MKRPDYSIYSLKDDLDVLHTDELTEDGEVTAFKIIGKSRPHHRITKKEN